MKTLRTKFIFSTWFSDQVILVLQNVLVKEINIKLLDLFSLERNDLIKLLMPSLSQELVGNCLIGFFNSLKTTGIVLYNPLLKFGTPIMLLNKFDPQKIFTGKKFTSKIYGVLWPGKYSHVREICRSQMLQRQNTTDTNWIAIWI